jgi:hypothetical protein
VEKPSFTAADVSEKEADMPCPRLLGIASAGFIALAASTAVVYTAEGRQAGGVGAAAAKASPELVGALSKELGATPEQAAGAAGALFGVAKSRLSAADFSKVAGAVPGMDALLKAAPAVGGGASGALSQAAGAAGGLGAAASAFSKLGLKPDMVAKAVPVLTSFVTKSGGADVGSLLAGALK